MKTTISLLLSLILLNLLVAAEGCGVVDEERIINGKEADPNSIPWQVALVIDGFDGIGCGGTIICSKFVMTAAHCTEFFKATLLPVSSLKVLAGEHDVNVYLDHATEHAVKAIHDHPDYRPFDNNFINYDFSILELQDPIKLTGSSKARAACLPEDTDTDFNSETKFVVSGWGKLNESNNHFPNVLHHVTVPWVSQLECNELISPKFDNLTTISCHICAGFDGVDSCTGDSGGPLTWLDPRTSRVKLIGVVSFGHGCGDPDFPGVYAKVTDVLPWIKDIIGSCSLEQPRAAEQEGPTV